MIDLTTDRIGFARTALLALPSWAFSVGGGFLTQAIISGVHDGDGVVITCYSVLAAVSFSFSTLGFMALKGLSPARVTPMEGATEATAQRIDVINPLGSFAGATAPPCEHQEV